MKDPVGVIGTDVAGVPSRIYGGITYTMRINFRFGPHPLVIGAGTTLLNETARVFIHAAELFLAGKKTVVDLPFTKAGGSEGVIPADWSKRTLIDFDAIWTNGERPDFDKAILTIFGTVVMPNRVAQEGDPFPEGIHMPKYTHTLTVTELWNTSQALDELWMMASWQDMITVHSGIWKPKSDREIEQEVDAALDQSLPPEQVEQEMDQSPPPPDDEPNYINGYQPPVGDTGKQFPTTCGNLKLAYGQEGTVRPKGVKIKLVQRQSKDGQRKWEDYQATWSLNSGGYFTTFGSDSKKIMGDDRFGGDVIWSKHDEWQDLPDGGAFYLGVRLDLDKEGNPKPAKQNNPNDPIQYWVRLSGIYAEPIPTTDIEE